MQVWTPSRSRRRDIHVVYSQLSPLLRLSLSLLLSLSLSCILTQRWVRTHALQALSISLSASFPSQAASLVSVLQSNNRQRDPRQALQLPPHVPGRGRSFSWSVAPAASLRASTFIRVWRIKVDWKKLIHGRRWRWEVGIGLTCEMAERLAGETWLQCRGKRISEESQNTWRCCLVRPAYAYSSAET